MGSKKWVHLNDKAAAMIILDSFTGYLYCFQVLGESLKGGQMCIVSLTGSASLYIKFLFVLW